MEYGDGMIGVEMRLKTNLL